MVGVYAPTALTCAPGATQAPRTTGSVAVVVVQIRSAPATASSAVATASTGRPVSRASRSANSDGALGRHAVHAHPAHGPHGPHRLQVRVRLRAGADDREVAGVRPREQVGCQPAHGRRADRRDRSRVDDRAQQAALGLEEQDDALVRVVLAAEVGGERGDDLDPHRLEPPRYDGMSPMTASPLGQPEHRAQRHHHVALGEHGQRPAHRRDGLLHREDLGDELLVGDQDLHEKSPFW